MAAEKKNTTLTARETELAILGYRALKSPPEVSKVNSTIHDPPLLRKFPFIVLHHGLLWRSDTSAVPPYPQSHRIHFHVLATMRPSPAPYLHLPVNTRIE